MKKQKCVANIKFSQQEVELMINALENLIKIEIPFRDSADWRKPYEMLLKDLKKIKLDINYRHFIIKIYLILFYGHFLVNLQLKCYIQVL